MAVDYFLKIPGVDGESTDEQFAGAIVLESYSFGVANAVSPGRGSGGGVGKATFTDLTITKRIDKSSPTLLLDCATGKHLPAVQLVSRRSPGVVYLQITLTDVLISSFQEAGTHGELPLEQISFNYQKLTYAYATQQPDGQIGTPIQVIVGSSGKF